jgi:hypothetical protein
MTRFSFGGSNLLLHCSGLEGWKFPGRCIQARALLAAASTGLFASPPASATNLGDLDGDSRVTSADYLLLQQHLGAQIQLSPSQIQAADANADGSISSADLPALRDLLLERFPPAVKSSSPAHLSVTSPSNRLELSFNKRYHDGGNLANGIRLNEAGPDKHLGTEDDISIPNSITAAPPLLSLNLDSTLPSGTYGLYASPPIADFQGRPMIPFAGKFLIPGDDPLRDSDFDGIPDPEEIATGTNPLLSDTDGDLADDLLERNSGTDPLDPDSIPGEAINPRTRMIALSSLPITYSNFPVDGGTTLPDWVSVRSSLVSYANLPFDVGSTLVDWVSVRSPVVSYANLPFDVGATPVDWVSVRSPVVSYANLPSDVGATPVNWLSVRSPVVSYVNASGETTNPSLSETVTFVSPVISYENTANL